MDLTVASLAGLLPLTTSPVSGMSLSWRMEAGLTTLPTAEGRTILARLQCVTLLLTFQ